MSWRSGHETKRKAVGEYRGYSLIKVTEIDYHRNIWGDGFDKDWLDNTEYYYRFCLVGEEKKPSSDYFVKERNLESVKNRIDSMLDKGEIILTRGEYHNYVKSPNKKNNYGLWLGDLLKLMEQHKKGDAKTKYIIEERLTDCNFHSEYDLISEEKYDEFKAMVLKTHALREKFEVYTYTEDVKRIKDPKRFEEGLSKVIEEYLASQGVKDTSVKVNFIEDW